MPFKITAMAPFGEISVDRPTGVDALESYLEFGRRGYQHIVVKDALGRTLSKREIEALTFDNEN